MLIHVIRGKVLSFTTSTGLDPSMRIPRLNPMAIHQETLTLRTRGRGLHGFTDDLARVLRTSELTRGVVVTMRG